MVRLLIVHSKTPFEIKARYLLQRISCLALWVLFMSMRQDAPEKQKAFYHSSAWLHCREGYLAKVGGLCERCMLKGIIRPARVVHHKEYITAANVTDPEELLA